MSKWNVVVSYSGAISMTVIAKTQEEAIEKGENKADSLSDKDFLKQLEPQHMGTTAEKI